MGELGRAVLHTNQRLGVKEGQLTSGLREHSLLGSSGWSLDPRPGSYQCHLKKSGQVVVHREGRGRDSGERGEGVKVRFAPLPTITSSIAGLLPSPRPCGGDGSSLPNCHRCHVSLAFGCMGVKMTHSSMWPRGQSGPRFSILMSFPTMDTVHKSMAGTLAGLG